MALIKSIAGNEVCDQTARNTFSSYDKKLYFEASGFGNTAAYMQMCTIKINGSYVNEPITIGVTDRAKLPTRIIINFANSDKSDPSISQFVRDGQTQAYIVKTATSTWALYVSKGESWCGIRVTEYDNAYDNDRVVVTWTGVNTASLPNGYVTASVLYDVKMIDDGAGNVTIKTL